MTKAFAPSEAQLQQAVLAYLGILEQQRVLYFVRNNSFSGFVQRPNQSLGYIKNSKPGTPDFLVCLRGCFIGVELKTATGRQSLAQKTTQGAIEASGGLYVLIRSVEALQAFIEGYPALNGDGANHH